MQNSITVLFVGDGIGKLGRRLIETHLPNLIKEKNADFVVLNGENLAGGRGITPHIYHSMRNAGANCITSGNHIWDNKAVMDIFPNETALLRPQNYKRSLPGQGTGFFTINGVKIGVLNLLGQLFMPAVNCPFETAEDILNAYPDPDIIWLVDLHGEATSEKIAMGYFLDGKVSAVVGTHTHVLTDDLKILENGTAYISDLGMTGPMNSVIGMQIKGVLHNFVTGPYHKVDVEEHGPGTLCGIAVTIDVVTKKAIKVEKIKLENL